ncbi:hypothetical protein NQ315_011812 [Exocentrus adspersus]|uniref:Aminoacylase-1 n=1 Tax=Exocentrus adspersus TaxID=1586481 RepID=A0AAV8W1X4_9CUCU|nr:hypothetical protein NQ315_011812 [Exocentrus adspersus]
MLVSRGLSLKTQVFPAATDISYLREKGVPALGFSPISKTPILLHANDEYLGVSTFLKGIDIYCKLLSSLGQV